MLNQIFTLSLFLFLTSNSLISQSNKIILRTDFDGKVTEGSIENLITKINEGKELSIGLQLDFDDDKISDL